ncbi:substrate-binding domain-containing protein [Actinoallomurus sp. NBC_01490]|uniref:substrate-binding domain-containing protein n=1 Tax=Actinoallomurus sp. NBC_01490 TaxID=2903557 RepID=UPI002E315FEF|nr:substrate-binding domain-containing protein [Actinoallomurus sp. NBC_01490]
MKAHRNPALSRFAVLASTAALVLAAGACSTSRQVGGSNSAAAEDCGGKSTAQKQIDAVWQKAGANLGLSGLRPAETNVCQVDTSKYKKNGPYTIAYASQGPTNSWAMEADYFIKNEAAKQNAKLLYASANGDAGTQVNNIQDLLAQKPDALIVQPMGSSVVGQVRQAAQRDIPVVVCTGRLPDGTPGVVSTVGRSYELQGTLLATWLAKKINGKGRIAILSGIPGVPTTEYEYQAAKKVFAGYPGIQVVTRQYTHWSPTEAKKVAAQLAVRYPNLDGIWTDSGVSETGVIQAYQAAHQKIPPMTGDSSNAFLRAASTASGVQFAQSAYPPEQTRTCLDTAVSVLQGKKVANVVEVNSAVYTNAELAKYYRKDCTDNLWIPTELTMAEAKKLKVC